MGCTHSKNSKSKSKSGKLRENQDKPLEKDASNKNKVVHFDNGSFDSKNDGSEVNEDATQPQYSRDILNESRVTQSTQKPQEIREEKGTPPKPTELVQEREVHKQSVQLQNQNSPPKKSELGKVSQFNTIKPNEDLRRQNKEPPPQITAAPSVAPMISAPPKVHVVSQYYPINEQHQQPQQSLHRNSPEKVLNKKLSAEKSVLPKRQQEAVKEKTIVLAPPYRPQLTAEDMECIRKSVQQRNERRAYMMAHRNETDDTLYELEHRMPEKDYTGRFEKTNMQAY